MKAAKHEIKEIVLIHVATVALVCAAFLIAALPYFIASGPGDITLSQALTSINPAGAPFLP